MGERKRKARLSAVHSPGAAALAGLRAVMSGDRATAERTLAALAADPPHDAEALHAQGVLALHLGRKADALEWLTSAVEREPRRADFRCHLAIARRRLGDVDRAMEELETAIAIDPMLPEAHSNLGNLLLDRAKFAEGREHLERAIALRPEYPDALNGLGNALLALGDPARACERFRHAIELDPNFHQARYNLSRACLHRALTARSDGSDPSIANAQAMLALEAILGALAIGPDDPSYWTQFEACVRDLDLRHPIDSRLREALFHALRHPAVDPARLVRPIASWIESMPGVADAATDPAANRCDDHERERLRNTARFVLGNEVVLRVIEEVTMPHALTQRIIEFARGELLSDRARGERSSPFLPLESVVAIAHQQFQTEYVAGATGEEQERLGQLAAAIEGDDRQAASSLHDVALYACYRPLVALSVPGNRVSAWSSTPIASLIARQIEEPTEESRLRSDIPALTPIDDDVSRAVRDQYERNPYPRWRRMRREPAEESLAGFLASRYPEADLDGVAGRAPRILIAGCGTGRHSILTAQRFPQSQVLAIDLSLNSLAYAVRKSREAGVTNIEHRQADLLALRGLDLRFDLIECSGVLHHLRDPIDGWRVLLSLLNRGGVMRIGLYSSLARRHVARARALAADRRFDPSPAGIRAFRRAVLARQDDPLLARVARGEDFYSESGCRDLVFHVQEHAFTIPEIAGALNELGLTLLGFDLADPAVAIAYRARFPDDRAMLDFDHWRAFEEEFPDTFSTMYQFWVRGHPIRRGALPLASDPPGGDDRHF